MVSRVASTSGAFQPAMSVSPIGGSSQTPSNSPVVEGVQERRRALDGELCSMAEFWHFYQ